MNNKKSITKHMIQKKEIMKLPELNMLLPNEETTFKKLVEEMAECNTEIQVLIDYENRTLAMKKNIYNKKEHFRILNNVASEIMDIAQVCASQLFVFKNNQIDVEEISREYFKEIENPHIFINVNNCRYIYFEINEINDDIQKTMNNIISLIGNIAQLSKYLGANGEQSSITKVNFNSKYIHELLKILKECFKLLNFMKEKYKIDLEILFSEHINKLKERNYLR